MTTVTQKRLKELLNYDPDTGLFTRRITVGRHGCYKAGTVAGCLCKHHGYVFIRIDDILYRAHRLAWLYVYGAWPPDQIDHRNRKRSDNRLKNLRLATGGQNLQNMVTGKGKSGLRGACSHPNGRWRAMISVDGISRNLGWYATAEQAHQAYLRAKEILHPFRPIV